jgi:hypothetical protein
VTASCLWYLEKFRHLRLQMPNSRPVKQENDVSKIHFLHHRRGDDVGNTVRQRGGLSVDFPQVLGGPDRSGI